jgi:hypothetical protein
MYTVGKLERGRSRLGFSPTQGARMCYGLAVVVPAVHFNGRINYEGEATLADGRAVDADRALLAAKKLRQAAERQAQAESAGNGEPPRWTTQAGLGDGGDCVKQRANAT